MQQVAGMQAEVAGARQLQKALAQVQTRCDVALELLGERNERIEQLEDDIADMRSIFHSQLELVVDQLNRAQQQPAAVMQQAAAPGAQHG
ncbi:TMF_TATA_bd domain-containing protein, partial [Haematococcus lacustris]